MNNINNIVYLKNKEWKSFGYVDLDNHDNNEIWLGYGDLDGILLLYDNNYNEIWLGDCDPDKILFLYNSINNNQKAWNLIGSGDPGGILLLYNNNNNNQWIQIYWIWWSTKLFLKY